MSSKLGGLDLGVATHSFVSISGNVACAFTVVVAEWWSVGGRVVAEWWWSEIVLTDVRGGVSLIL